MDRLQFVLPIRIAPDRDDLVTEIYSVDQALDFLQGWPSDRQVPVYRTAFKACAAAMVDQIPAEDARQCFTSFARLTGILAQDVILRTSLEPDNWISP